VGNSAYAATPHIVPSDGAHSGRLAVITGERFGSDGTTMPVVKGVPVGKGVPIGKVPVGEGITVPVVAATRMPRMAGAPIACLIRRRGPVQPAFNALNQGVRADVCPGHRSWGPPV
jgi:hypothetical protein